MIAANQKLMVNKLSTFSAQTAPSIAAVSAGPIFRPTFKPITTRWSMAGWLDALVADLSSLSSCCLNDFCALLSRYTIHAMCACTRILLLEELIEIITPTARKRMNT